MKHIFIFFTCLLSLQFTATQAQVKKAALQASGLTCAMCSNATLKSLQTLPFVDKIETDLNTTTFNIYFKKDAAVNVDALKEKVEDAGFSVAKLVLTADFHQTSIKKDAHIDYNGLVLHFVGVKDQVLNGEQQITVVDKNFVPNKTYKKYAAMTDMTCIQTGHMGTCCNTAATSIAGSRVYHVTI